MYPFTCLYAELVKSVSENELVHSKVLFVKENATPLLHFLLHLLMQTCILLLQVTFLNCTPESGHGILQLPCIVDSESATWTGKVHDIPTL